MTLVPMAEALTQAAADVLAIQLTSVRGHLSRRQARRAVDRLADALEATARPIRQSSAAGRIRISTTHTSRPSPTR